MEAPIFEIAAGVLLGGMMLMSLYYGLRVSFLDPEWENMTAWQSMTVAIPLLFLAWAAWLYL